MDIQFSFLSYEVQGKLQAYLESLELDVKEIVDSRALACLKEIQAVIQDENLDDFYAIEAIVSVFEKYGIDAGTRHDFG